MGPAVYDRRRLHHYECWQEILQDLRPPYRR